MNACIEDSGDTRKRPKRNTSCIPTYLRARYYEPATQQFLTVDPLLAATEQAYAYAAGSPLNATDPSGLHCGQINDDDEG